MCQIIIIHRYRYESPILHNSQKGQPSKEQKDLKDIGEINFHDNLKDKKEPKLTEEEFKDKKSFKEKEEETTIYNLSEKDQKSQKEKKVYNENKKEIKSHNDDHIEQKARNNDEKNNQNPQKLFEEKQKKNQPKVEHKKTDLKLIYLY